MIFFLFHTNPISLRFLMLTHKGLRNFFNILQKYWDDENDKMTNTDMNPSNPQSNPVRYVLLLLPLYRVETEV